MNDFKFADYCESFLSDHLRGTQIFFQDKDHKYHYSDLIKEAIAQSHYFVNSPDTFFALKMESSYRLFTHLIGAILAQKKVLIISHKLPEASISEIQKNIPFTTILTDHFQKAPENLSFPNVQLNPEHPAFFILSSGSTGPSKGIPLSLKNIFYSATSVINFFNMTPSDTSFSNLPHHHIGGLMIFWRAFFSGGKVTTDENQDYQFTSLVPLQLQRILTDEKKVAKLQQCHAILIGGAPLSDQLKNSAAKKSLHIVETYGMSETCSLVLLNGKPLEGQEVMLDSEGYFLIKGSTLSPSVPIDKNGFYHTKDIGVKNLDGTFSFKHRGDLLFKSAGELIDPLAIESKTRELSWISEAIVVPIKHHEWTHCAVMVYKTSDETKIGHDIKEYLKKHFHPHHVPKYFILAPKDLITDGVKPRRFEISLFAQEHYYKKLFHYLYIPHASSKKLMVFLHGFMEDHTDMIPLMDNHHETSFLFIDLPGHGRTTANNFKERSNVFTELLSLINFYKKQNELTLYGYSMGGRIAIELTLMGLSSSALILESSHFGLSTDEEKQIRLNADRKLLSSEKIDLTTFFDEWYKNPIFGDYNKSSHYIIDIQKKIYHNHKEWQNSLEFFSPGAFPYTQSEVTSILKNQNIIVITGQKDKKYLDHFHEMKLKIPNISINEIENCGHNPHKTHLNEIKKILRFNC